MDDFESIEEEYDNEYEEHENNTPSQDFTFHLDEVLIITKL